MNQSQASASKGARLFSLAVLVLLPLLLQGWVHAFTLNVQDPAGNPIPVGYRFLVEEDVTFHPDPDAVLPEPDPNALGTSFHKSYMPVVTKGSSADLTPLDGLDPAKHYFISILPDSDFALGGGSVKPGQTSLTVTVNPYPLPTAQISIFVFEDIQPVNNAADLPQEQGLPGFQVVLEDAAGKVGAGAGQALYDAFGNPLGTSYVQVNGNFVYDIDGNPIVDVLGDGSVTTNANGVAVIKNLAPGKYGVFIDPPEGQGWIQTATIEGTQIIDAWVKPNEPPYFTEFGPVGHHAIFGFVKEMNAIPAGGTANLTGKVVSTHNSRPPDYTFWPGAAFPDIYVGLNDMSVGRGNAIYVAKGAADSTFAIPNVPDGNYQLAIWDDNLDIVFASQGITINGGQCLQTDGTYGSCSLGDVGVFDWFAHLRGSVFFDDDEDGFPDPGEVGIPDQAVNLRLRDGTVYQQAATGMDGSYNLDQVFPFFNWLVAEVDFARYKATGATFVVDAGGQVLPHNGWDWPSYGRMTPQAQDQINPHTGNNLSRTEIGEVLTQGYQAFLGQENYIHWGKTEYGPGPDGEYGTADDENGGISGMVFYDTTRAEDDPRYNGGEPWQPGIPNVTVNLYRIDGRDADGKPDQLTLINQTQTDSWDADLPDGCPGDPADVFYDMDSDGNGDCYDGLRNFNQVRPGVFDGGYAFASYWEPSFGAPGAVEVEGLPIDNYVVEVIPPPNYELVGSLDRNVDFGDEFSPTTLALPPACVGETVNLPADATLSLFPGVPAPLAGSSYEECDRKEVIVQSGRNAAADFFLFTEVPPAAHVKGMILNDLANEFDPNNPVFGEKFAPEFVPVSFRDYNGREITRIYSDQYGNYNALVPSMYTNNVGMPSGMSPNMLVACMNDPGPIEDPSNPGTFITDPQYKSQYSQFCYTFQYIPATTTYLDTPVVPIAAFAGENQDKLDCEFPDGTPMILSAIGPAYNGPYVEEGQTLVITAMGPTEVPNPAGPPALVERDYGFGITEGTVWIGNTQLTDVTWSAGSISATIPAGAQTGQLRVVRGDNGLSTRMGVTVTVGPIAGTVHTVASAGGWPATPIQDAIDMAQPGDLILVAPGTYDEMVILWKEVQLQGAGAPSTVIRPAKVPGEKLVQWRDDIAALVTNNDITLLPGQVLNFDPANNEPGLFNETEGAGVMVLAQAAGEPLASTWTGEARVDGFTITGSDTGGAIAVNGYAEGLEISNNRMIGNAGLANGGIGVGVPAAGGEIVDAHNDNLNIHNNHITQNGAMTHGSGGISLFTGADNYSVTDNDICGNFTLGAGGGIGHHGLNNGGLIARNRIFFNQSFNQMPGMNTHGGGIVVEGLAEIGAATVGSGSVTIDRNLIQGNLAGAGDGGGIRLAFVDGQDALSPYPIHVINNMIVNNVAGLAGGGISLQDAEDVTIAHNTVAHNDSTATAGAAFLGDLNTSTAQPAGIVSRANSAELAAIVGPGFSNPTLVNNIIRNNRSFYWSATANGGVGGLLPDPASPVYNDLAVLGGAGALNPQSCVLTDATPYPGNFDFDPVFASPYFNGPSSLTAIPEDPTPLDTAAAVDEGGNFIDARFGPLQPVGDYHLLSISPARDSGQDVANPASYPGELDVDFDADNRDRSAPDVGADEFNMATSPTDTVTITKATYVPDTNKLKIQAYSSLGMAVTLTAEAIYVTTPVLLGPVPSNGDQAVFRMDGAPTAVRVTSTGGGSATADLGGVDTVTITKATYDPATTKLKIQAYTSFPYHTVTLTAYSVTGGTPTLLGTVPSNSDQQVFRLPAKPDEVRVDSTGGGTATKAVP